MKKDTDIEMIGKLIEIGYDPEEPPIQVQLAICSIATAKEALHQGNSLVVMECLVRAEMMLNRTVGSLEGKWPPKQGPSK